MICSRSSLLEEQSEWLLVGLQMPNNQGYNRPLQHAKYQECMDIECNRKQSSVHDIEGQMDHDNQKYALLAVIKDPGDVNRKGQHKKEV